jgi:hypothetical protein
MIYINFFATASIPIYKKIVPNIKYIYALIAITTIAIYKKIVFTIN